MTARTAVSQISIVTTHEAEEPIAALLESLFGAAPAIYTNVEKGHSIVTLYARTSTRALKERTPELRSGFDELRKLDLNIGTAEVMVRKVPREDWSESWKKYFKAIQIGSALLIKPSWSQQRAKAGQAVMVLDPGLSFGTGQHATTSFCLREIVRNRRQTGTQHSLLDAGCGSGILAIAGAKLGYQPVEAFDFDPVSVRVARMNCRSNRVEGKVKLSRKDLTKMPVTCRAKYAVVCANLMAELLISERDKLLARLASRGTLVLAGILEGEFAKVRACYEETGLRLIRTKVEREWQSGTFESLHKSRKD